MLLNRLMSNVKKYSQENGVAPFHREACKVLVAFVQKDFRDPFDRHREVCPHKSSVANKWRRVPMTGLSGSAPVDPLLLPFRMRNRPLEPERVVKV